MHASPLKLERPLNPTLPQDPFRANLRSARVVHGTIVPQSSVIGDVYREAHFRCRPFPTKWPARVIPDGPILATLPKAASSAALRQPTYVTRQRTTSSHNGNVRPRRFCAASSQPDPACEPSPASTARAARTFESGQRSTGSLTSARWCPISQPTGERYFPAPQVYHSHGSESTPKADKLIMLRLCDRIVQSSRRRTGNIFSEPLRSRPQVGRLARRRGFIDVFP